MAFRNAAGPRDMARGLERTGRSGTRACTAAGHSIEDEYVLALELAESAAWQAVMFELPRLFRNPRCDRINDSRHWTGVGHGTRSALGEGCSMLCSAAVVPCEHQRESSQRY